MRYGVWAPIPQYASGVRKWNYGRNGKRITAVVIHKMDGTLDGSDSWLRSPKSGSASTHFAVGTWGWLNRTLGRYQIRQWVDTNNTAYGWSARPTDTPTPLARNVLAPDIYNGSADLNWQVIHIETEGWSYQKWPNGLTVKVKELLNAIARTHGPLRIMAHTDISSKPCPGMTTVPWTALGGYGGRLGVPVSIPDTSGPLYVKFNAGVNGVNMRTAPDARYNNVYAIAYSDTDPKPNGIILQPAYGGLKWIGNTSARRTRYGVSRGKDGQSYYKLKMAGTDRYQYVNTRFMHPA